MKIIQPNWAVSSAIHAASTTRIGGQSQAPYNGLNLGAHVGDRVQDVTANRDLLSTELSLPNQPLWLNQIHSDIVLDLPSTVDSVDADAVVTHQKNQICLVMTADCLPVLLTDQKGIVVAAVHAGWRGLCDGILERTVEVMQVENHEIHAWLGPAISQQCFEVGEEVRQQFVAQHAESNACFIASSNPGKWMADIYQLARIRLQSQGVIHITGGDYCTFSDAEMFYSYRRDGVTGRMASLIWIE
ncbi:MAG TPA: peptidoglycan editing factor PgeF [Thiotrichaceae bacterium]|nr:peptidoglycan editing factor PgeF [Thiotrichaceae bacterium]